MLEPGVSEAFVSARAEILKRIELRDRMVVTFFSISIAILGGTMLAKDPMIGLLIPVFGLGATVVVCQHTAAIHSICCWTRRETPFPHWGRSKELRKLHRGALPERAVAQAAVFMSPSLVALAYGYVAAFSHVSVLLSGLWWLGVALELGIALFQWKTLVSVVALNRQTGYEHARHLSQRLQRLARARDSASASSRGKRDPNDQAGDDSLAQLLSASAK